MNTLKYNAIITLLFTFALMAKAYAQTTQSLDDIEQAAYVYSLTEVQAQYDNAQVVVGKLDSRLRLERCNKMLKTSATFQNSSLGSQTVKVSCVSPTNWTVYVPVKVKVFKPVVVTASVLAAKQIITAGDVRVEQLDIATMRRGYIDDPKQIIGKQVKYPIALGTAINPNSLIAQKVIQRGEHIMLVATVGKMEVRMSGTALSDGQQGQRLRVKNASSKRIVEGVVHAPGVVRVTM